MKTKFQALFAAGVVLLAVAVAVYISADGARNLESPKLEVDKPVLTDKAAPLLNEGLDEPPGALGEETHGSHHDGTGVAYIQPPVQAEGVPEPPSDRKTDLAISDSGGSDTREDDPQAEKEALPPEVEAVREVFGNAAGSYILGCVTEFVGQGHSFRGSVAFHLRATRVEDGTLEYQVDGIETKVLGDDDPASPPELSDNTAICLHDSVSSLVTDMPDAASEFFESGDEAHFNSDFTFNLKGAQVQDE